MSLVEKKCGISPISSREVIKYMDKPDLIQDSIKVFLFWACLVCCKWEENVQVRNMNGKYESVSEKLRFVQVSFTVFGCNVKA